MNFGFGNLIVVLVHGKADIHSVDNTLKNVDTVEQEEEQDDVGQHGIQQMLISTLTKESHRTPDQETVYSSYSENYLR